MNLDDITLAIGSLDVVDIRDILQESGIEITMSCLAVHDQTENFENVDLTFDIDKFKNALLKRLQR